VFSLAELPARFDYLLLRHFQWAGHPIFNFPQTSLILSSHDSVIVALLAVATALNQVRTLAPVETVTASEYRWFTSTIPFFFQRSNTSVFPSFLAVILRHESYL